MYYLYILKYYNVPFSIFIKIEKYIISKQLICLVLIMNIRYFALSIFINLILIVLLFHRDPNSGWCDDVVIYCSDYCECHNQTEYCNIDTCNMCIIDIIKHNFVECCKSIFANYSHCYHWQNKFNQINQMDFYFLA